MYLYINIEKYIKKHNASILRLFQTGFENLHAFQKTVNFVFDY